MLNVNNIQVFLKDMGKGPPVLFLHGNPDSSEIWAGIAEKIAHKYRCIMPDLPGFGRSAAPDDFYPDADSMANFCHGLLQNTGASGPVHLVVHDFGGPYGLFFALEYPKKIKSITAINTLFHHDYKWHFWARVWRTPFLGEFSMLAMNKFMLRREMLRGGKKLTEEHIQKTWELITPSMKTMVLKLYRATDPEKFPESDAALEGLSRKIPIMALWGDHDPYIPKRFAERFFAEKVVHFPDCGHWLPVEAPDEVSRELLEFWGEN